MDIFRVLSNPEKVNLAQDVPAEERSPTPTGQPVHYGEGAGSDREGSPPVVPMRSRVSTPSTHSSRVSSRLPLQRPESRRSSRRGGEERDGASVTSGMSKSSGGTSKGSAAKESEGSRRSSRRSGGSGRSGGSERSSRSSRSGGSERSRGSGGSGKSSRSGGSGRTSRSGGSGRSSRSGGSGRSGGSASTALSSLPGPAIRQAEGEDPNDPYYKQEIQYYRRQLEALVKNNNTFSDVLEKLKAGAHVPLGEVIFEVDYLTSQVTLESRVKQMQTEALDVVDLVNQMMKQAKLPITLASFRDKVSKNVELGTYDSDLRMIMQQNWNASKSDPMTNILTSLGWAFASDVGTQVMGLMFNFISSNASAVPKTFPTPANLPSAPASAPTTPAAPAAAAYAMYDAPSSSPPSSAARPSALAMLAADDDEDDEEED